MAWSCSSCHYGLFSGECEGVLGFAQAALVDLGLILHGHGKPTNKNRFPPLILGILELEIFTGLGFHVKLVDSAFGVLGYSFLWF